MNNLDLDIFRVDRFEQVFDLQAQMPCHNKNLLNICLLNKFKLPFQQGLSTNLLCNFRDR